MADDQNNIDTIIENARIEIGKVQSKKKQDNLTYTNNILENSISFADNVLKNLVAHTINKDVEDLFDTCDIKQGHILINDDNDELNNYTLSLDIVDNDYMLDLKHFKNNKDIKERIVFLLNTVKVLYCPIKDYMKKLSQEDGSYNFNYVLQIGLNTTLFLDKDSKKRIGIILTPVDKL
jgi:hypothetical protein